MSATRDAAARPRSSFFFTGRLEPGELANFNVQNQPLRDRRGAIFEALGQGMAIWWPSRPRADFVDLADAARAWFRTIPAAFYIQTEVALEPSLVGWVEAVDVEVPEASIGFADARFLKVSTPPEDAPVNKQMREAILLARSLRQRGGEIERASHELLASANDGSAQCFLSAFRALECIRRIYEPKYDRRKQGWAAMARDLPSSNPKLSALLSDAAEAVRHGDVPTRQRARHPVNVARRRRSELIGFTREIVNEAIAKQV
jgi:hypothetical protein